MNRNMGWFETAMAFVLCGMFGAMGYFFGYDRGERFGERTKVIYERVTEELPPPYAQACSDMMETAWSMLRDDIKPTDQEKADLLGR